MLLKPGYTHEGRVVVGFLLKKGQANLFLSSGASPISDSLSVSTLFRLLFRGRGDCMSPAREDASRISGAEEEASLMVWLPLRLVACLSAVVLKWTVRC